MSTLTTPRTASVTSSSPAARTRQLVQRAKEKAEAVQIEVPCLTCNQRDATQTNSDVRISTFDLIDYTNMPWKNGKGETTQLAIYPLSATPNEQFDYRITSAAMTTSSVFSRYPGYTRHLIVLDEPVSAAHPVVHHDHPDRVDRAPKIAIHHDKSKLDLKEGVEDDDGSEYKLAEGAIEPKKESEEYAIHHMLPFSKHRFHGDWKTHVSLTSLAKTEVTGFHVSDFNVFTNDKACFALCDVVSLRPGASESFVLQHELTKKHHHYIYIASHHAEIDLIAVDSKTQLRDFWRAAPSVNPFQMTLHQGQMLKIDSLRHKHKDGGHPEIGVRVVAPKDHATAVIVVSIEFIDGQ